MTGKRCALVEVPIAVDFLLPPLRQVARTKRPVPCILILVKDAPAATCLDRVLGPLPARVRGGKGGGSEKASNMTG